MSDLSSHLDATAASTTVVFMGNSSSHERRSSKQQAAPQTKKEPTSTFHPIPDRYETIGEALCSLRIGDLWSANWTIGYGGGATEEVQQDLRWDEGLFVLVLCL